MNKLILEYIWLDGHTTPNLRSKVKVVDWMPAESVKPENLPMWNFDGSSTNQAPGNDSECLLKPSRIYESGHNGIYYVLCEVLNTDGTPHESNSRMHLSILDNIAKREGYWFAFEQEYFITKDCRPIGFPDNGYPPPQGFYYCGVGTGQVEGRRLADVHMMSCLEMGIGITGTNAEVAIGQWEYQCFAEDAMKACDDLWMSRFILYRLAEDFGFGIDLNPKPIQGDWNGSGCHTNFSTNFMRESGGEEYFELLMKCFEKNHEKHIRYYGENNDQRLTGLHETQRIDKFSWGVGDRGASFRIPNSVEANGWKGYVEDRRPASNCDPYRVASLIISTTQEGS